MDIETARYRIKKEAWLAKQRERLNNKDFTLFSNNCLAGFIYHDLGLRFDSPTINTRIERKYFYYFALNPKAYLDSEVIEDYETEEKLKIPVGIIKPEGLPYIRVRFEHYASFEEAKEAWDRRKKRVNYDNMFFIMEVWNTHGKYIKEIDRLNIKKLIITYEKIPEVENQYVMKFDRNMDNLIYTINEDTGKRNLDELDYISFLNNETVWREEFE